jgi:hypothetical protein
MAAVCSRNERAKPVADANDHDKHMIPKIAPMKANMR